MVMSNQTERCLVSPASDDTSTEKQREEETKFQRFSDGNQGSIPFSISKNEDQDQDQDL